MWHKFLIRIFGVPNSTLVPEFVSAVSHYYGIGDCSDTRQNHCLRLQDAQAGVTSIIRARVVITHRYE